VHVALLECFANEVDFHDPFSKLPLWKLKSFYKQHHRMELPATLRGDARLRHFLKVYAGGLRLYGRGEHARIGVPSRDKLKQSAGALADNLSDTFLWEGAGPCLPPFRLTPCSKPEEEGHNVPAWAVRSQLEVEETPCPPPSSRSCSMASWRGSSHRDGQGIASIGGAAGDDCSLEFLSGSDPDILSQGLPMARSASPCSCISLDRRSSQAGESWVSIWTASDGHSNLEHNVLDALDSLMPYGGGPGVQLMEESDHSPDRSPEGSVAPMPLPVAGPAPKVVEAPTVRDVALAATETAPKAAEAAPEASALPRLRVQEIVGVARSAAHGAAEDEGPAVREPEEEFAAGLGGEAEGEVDGEAATFHGACEPELDSEEDGEPAEVARSFAEPSGEAEWAAPPVEAEGRDRVRRSRASSHMFTGMEREPAPEEVRRATPGEQVSTLVSLRGQKTVERKPLASKQALRKKQPAGGTKAVRGSSPHERHDVLSTEDCLSGHEAGKLVEVVQRSGCGTAVKPRCPAGPRPPVGSPYDARPQGQRASSPHEACADPWDVPRPRSVSCSSRIYADAGGAPGGAAKGGGALVASAKGDDGVGKRRDRAPSRSFSASASAPASRRWIPGTTKPAGGGGEASQPMLQPGPQRGAVPGSNRNSQRRSVTRRRQQVTPGYPTAGQAGGAGGGRVRQLSAKRAARNSVNVQDQPLEMEVGSIVGGFVTHSSWMGAFVNVGAGIDGLVDVSLFPAGEEVKTGDFITNLTVQEVDLAAPRLLLNAVRARVVRLNRSSS